MNSKLIKHFFKDREYYTANYNLGSFALDAKIMEDIVIPRNIVKHVALTELKQVKDIFDRFNVPFFLTHGSCLGAVIDKSFVRFDSDIDIGCYKIDIDSIILAIQKLRSQYKFKVTKLSVNDESIAIIKDNVVIDISLYRNNHKYWQANKSKVFEIPYIFLEKLEELDFLGIKVKVPSNVEAYLKFQYGSDWRTPIRDFYNPYRLKIEQPIIKILKFIIGKKYAKCIAKNIVNIAKRIRKK